MPFYDVVCPACQAEQRDVWANVGASVACCVCGAATQRLWTKAPAVTPDEWPGGKVIENLDDHPITVYSRSQLRREMDARGLIPFVRHVQGSKETSNWHGAIDPYTMAAATSLVSNVKSLRSEGDEICHTLKLEVRKL